MKIILANFNGKVQHYFTNIKTRGFISFTKKILKVPSRLCFSSAARNESSNRLKLKNTVTCSSNFGHGLVTTVHNYSDQTPLVSSHSNTAAVTKEPLVKTPNTISEPLFTEVLGSELC